MFKPLALGAVAIGAPALGSRPGHTPSARRAHRSGDVGRRGDAQGRGKIGDAARFPLIELKEPEKSVVLAWQPGQPVPRVVTVNVKEGGEGFKGEVDLAAKRC